MSRSVDVNILLYASDTGSDLHDKATSCIENLLGDGEILYVSWLTVMSYLRMATHPRIFRKPLSQGEAESNVGSLVAAPHVQVVREEEGFWDVYREVSGETAVRANLVPDAHLAAILRQNGIRTLYTHDRDFRKFDFLRVLDPLT